jgi:hypothetical protein
VLTEERHEANIGQRHCLPRSERNDAHSLDQGLRKGQISRRDDCSPPSQGLLMRGNDRLDSQRGDAAAHSRQPGEMYTGRREGAA